MPVMREPEVWHVAFTDIEDSGHWARWLLRSLPHPRHVVCFRDTPGGLLSVEQTLERLHPDVTPGLTAAAYAQIVREAGGTVHVVTVPARRRPRLRPFSCVDVARSLLAMPWRIQTPRGLEVELSRNER